MCLPANPDIQHAKFLGRVLRASELWQAALALTGSRLLDLVMLWGGGGGGGHPSAEQTKFKNIIS